MTNYIKISVLVVFSVFLSGTAFEDSLAQENLRDEGTMIADEAQANIGSFGRAKQNICKNSEYASEKLFCLVKSLKRRPGVLVEVGSSEVNGSSVKEILEARELMFAAAVLDAKVKIAEAHNAKLQAKDSQGLSVKGKPQESIDEEEKRSLAKQRQSVLSEYKSLMEDIGDVEGRRKLNKLNVAEGPGFLDRMTALLDGTIKRVDPSYNPEQLEQKQSKRLSQTEKQYIEMLSELKNNVGNLKRKEASLTSRIDEIDSAPRRNVRRDVSIDTEHALIGATVLNSAEGFVSGQNTYEVAVAVAWSENLQRRALNALVGDALPEHENSNSMSIDGYLDTLDVEGMAGGRMVIVEDGTPWFVGFGMSLASENSIENDLARDEARLDAAANLGNMMNANTKAHRGISKNLNERSGTNPVRKFSKSQVRKFSSEVEIDFPMETLTELSRHPNPLFGGEKVNIVVVGTNAVLNSDVKMFLLKQNKALKDLNVSQSYKRGFINRLKEIREQSKDDPTSYEKGQSDAAMDTRELDRNATQQQNSSSGTMQEGVKIGGGMITKGL